MPELPWTKWFPQDWLSDPALSVCRPSTRGIWADAVNVMLLKRTGTLTATFASFCMLLRASETELKLAFEEIQQNGVGCITMQNECITISCRRLVRIQSISDLRSKAASKRWGKDDAKPYKQEYAKGLQEHDAKGYAPSASASASACTQEEGGMGGTVKVPPETLPFLPPADEVRIAPDSIKQIGCAHDCYVRVTGQAIPLRPEIERAWLEFLRTHSTEELALVARYLKNEIKHTRRNPGSLKFSNMVANLPRFEEDLAMARGWARNNKPVTERDKVLALTGRPTAAPPVDKTPAPIVAKLMADLRAAVK